MFSWLEASSACQAPVEKIAHDMVLDDSSPAGETGDLSSIRPGKRGASPEGHPGLSAEAVRHGRRDFRGKVSLSQVHLKSRADGAFARQKTILRELCVFYLKVLPQS